MNADDVDLGADLNAEDDDGFGWSLLIHARDPRFVHIGSTLRAGNGYAQMTVRVVAVDDDGQVQFEIIG